MLSSRHVQDRTTDASIHRERAGSVSSMPTPTERLRAAILAEEALTLKQRRAAVRMIEPGLAFDAVPVKRPLRGVSRLGGTPDISADWPGWPNYCGWPMVFVGQLALSEIYALIPGVLPAKGMLYFFAHITPEWGYLFIPDNEESAVRYSKKKPTESAPWHSGLPEIFRVPPHRLKFRPVATLPEETSRRVAKLGFTLDQQEAYRALTEDVGPNRVLGRPCEVQWVVGADWAEAVARRKKGADPGFGNLLSWEDRTTRAEDFRHLLSFDMSQVVPKLGTSHIYFGVRKRDLRIGNFEKTALVYQDS